MKTVMETNNQEINQCNEGITVFTCEKDFESMMTCIYEAWASKLGHAHVRLETEPIGQQELFYSYVHVEPDEKKAQSVVNSIQQKIGRQAFILVYYASKSDVSTALDTIYRFLILGFAYGSRVTGMLTSPTVMEITEIRRRVGNEAHYFREFMRFSAIQGKVYVAHFEPKCDVLFEVAEHFADRMPSEYWIIVDDNRKVAAIHPKNRAFYVTNLNEKEFESLAQSEMWEDVYKDYWQTFFDTIGIEQRKNYECQRNHIPLWMRKHTPEFQK